MTGVEILAVISNIATAVGVGVAVWQLVIANGQNVTNFEDNFAKEYRELAAKLPTKAFLGEPLTNKELSEHFDEMYHYFDLCNEQAFLKKVGRISDETWVFWKDGIQSNLERPAFERAWSEIASRANGNFSELKELFPPKAYVRNKNSHV